MCGIIQSYPFYSSISFIFSISVANRNDRPYPHLWQAEGRDPVPRWRVQYKSSASGHESHLVFRKDFHTIDSTCDHVNILVPLNPLFRFSLFPIFLVFLFINLFCPPQGTGAAEFRGLLVSQLDTYNCYVLCHLTSCTSYLSWTL